MSFLTVSDGRRIYFEHYRGSRLPVVLIHGWGMSCRVWDTTLPSLLDAGHTVVSFDHRGCGQSDKDFSEVSIEHSGEDVAALLRQLRIDRAVLNGWSLGGAVAVAAAQALGRACAGVVLTCGATPRYVQAPDFPHGVAPGSAAQTAGALREDRASFLAALAKAVCAAPQTPAVENWLCGIFMQAAPSADAALMQLDTIDQRRILAALEAPVLSVVGSKDGIVPPEIGRQAAAIAKHGTLAELEASGHAPFLEEGRRYREILLDFLRPLG